MRAKKRLRSRVLTAGAGALRMALLFLVVLKSASAAAECVLYEEGETKLNLLSTVAGAPFLNATAGSRESQSLVKDETDEWFGFGVEPGVDFEAAQHAGFRLEKDPRRGITNDAATGHVEYYFEEITTVEIMHVVADARCCTSLSCSSSF